MKSLYPLLISLFLSASFAVEEKAPAQESTLLLTAEKFNTLQEEGKKSGTYQRKELVRFLESPYLGVRCQALDLLEDMAGDDFDLDPWLEAERISEDVRENWKKWATGKTPLANRGKPLTPEEAEKAIGILLSGNETARERICRQLLPHRNEAIIQIETYLQKQAATNDAAKAVLREAQFRLQLDNVTTDARLLAKKLTGRNRDDIIDSLEALRKGDLSTLPAIEQFLTDKDPLIRETAVDLFLTNGNEQALAHLLPQLNTEKDPNILQVAFRRSLNYESEGLNELLVRSLFNGNEEMTITALECLRDRTKDNNFGNTSTTPPPFLTDSQWEDLLNRPEWRIRQAALDFLSAHKETPELGDKVTQRIMKLLHDEDDSVRFSAFSASAKIPMEGKSALFEEMAFKNPEYLPQILYVLMASRAPLSTAMQEMIRRLPEDQVSRLLRQENELPSMLTSSNLNKTASLVKKNLFANKNPNSAFQMALLVANNLNLETTPEEWEILLNALYSEEISPELKKQLVSSFHFYRYNIIGKSLLYLNQLEAKNTVKNKYTSNDLSDTEKKTVAEIKPYLVSLLTFLKKTGHLYKQKKYEAIAQRSIALLIECEDKETFAFLEKNFSEFPKDLRADLAENICRRDDSLDNFKLWEIIAVDKEKEVRKTLEYLFSNLDSFSLEDTFDSNSEKSKGGKKAEELFTAFFDKLFTHPEYGEEHWQNVLTSNNDLFWNFFSKETRNELPFFDRYVLSAVDRQDFSLNNRAIATFLRTAVKCPDLPKNEKVIPDGIGPIPREILTALYDFPTDSKLIPEWAEKWSRSPVMEVRLNVAGLLLNTKNLQFFFSISPKQLITFSPNTLIRKNDPGYEKSSEDYHRKKGPDCPPKLMETILKLSEDTAPEVRIIANLSLLSNTRRCNVEKLTQAMKECLARSKAQKDDSHVEKLNILLERIQSYFHRMMMCRISRNISEQYTGFYSDTRTEEAQNYELSADENYLCKLFINEFFFDHYWESELKNLKRDEKLIVSFRDMLATENSDLSGENLSGKTSTTTELAVSRGAYNPDEHILLVFFEKPGCSECSRVEKSLHRMRQDYPNLRIEKYSITEPEGIEYNALLCSRFYISQPDRLVAPAIFTGDGALMRDRLTDDNLQKLIADNSRPWNDGRPSGGGIIPEWARHDETGIREAQGDLQKTYTSLSLGVVLLGGLIDGINPCAFATLIFFLSYLQIARRSPRELLMTGGAFVLSVYLTYFAIGLAFHELIGRLQSWSFLKTGMDYLFIFLALLAAALSFRDAWLAKQGRLSDMSLTLPSFLKEKIRAVTRQQSKSRNYIIAAALSGIVISALELACTGQVYAPIIYQIKQGNLPAVGMLAIYNLAFILPLLLIFLLTYKGLKTEALIRFQKKHTFLIKFLLGVLFVLLAVIILWGAGL